jgi:hypothetical protein
MTTSCNDSIERKRACLEAAIDACCGDRALNYGKPEDNFQRIAILWSAWFHIRKEPPDSAVPFSPFDVAIMNILLKIARLANSPGHADSWIDIAGYAACGADITESQGNKSSEIIHNIVETTARCAECDRLLIPDPAKIGHWICPRHG